MEDYSNNTGPTTGQPQGQGSDQQAGQTLGIASLITAIITFVLAVIPCVGLIAIIPGIIAIVLASVGLTQASRNSSPKGVLIAGLIIAIVATIISFSQIFVAGRISDKFKNKWGGDIENVIKDVQENVMNDLEDANVSIKINSNGDSVEIKAGVNKMNREKALEELETGNEGSNDTLDKKE